MELSENTVIEEQPIALPNLEDLLPNIQLDQDEIEEMIETPKHTSYLKSKVVQKITFIKQVTENEKEQDPEIQEKEKLYLDKLGKSCVVIYKESEKENFNLEEIKTHLSKLFEANDYKIYRKEKQIYCYCHSNNTMKELTPLSQSQKWAFRSIYPTIVHLQGDFKFSSFCKQFGINERDFKSHNPPLKKSLQKRTFEELEEFHKKTQTTAARQKKQEEKKEREILKQEQKKKEKQDKEEKKKEEKEKTKLTNLNSKEEESSGEDKKKDYSYKYKMTKCSIGSRNNDSVATPKDLYNSLNLVYKFDHDPCPLSEEIIIDGLDLKNPWGQMNFVNPPYSGIGKWIQRACHEAVVNKKASICLIPIRIGTRYWSEYILKYAHYMVILGQIKFDGFKGLSPFKACAVYFDGNERTPRNNSVDILRIGIKEYQRIWFF